jgi:hypothetical protein
MWSHKYLMKTDRQKTTFELKNSDKLATLAAVLGMTRTKILDSLIELEYANQQLFLKGQNDITNRSK